MKLTEAVSEAFYDAMSRHDIAGGKALEAALERLREELEGDEVVQKACLAAYVPPISEERRADMRAALRIALNSVLGDKEKGL